MADIIGLAASAASGGVFGLLGTALGRIASMFERRQNMAHETRRWQHELQLLELQQSAAQQETEAELQISQTEASWAGLQASLAADAAIAASYRWVDAVRGLTRPLLTVLLWMITAAIWAFAYAADRSSIVETATFAATAATLWWFGDRSQRSPTSRV
ncbi:MAG: hypothetical protein AAGH49_08870 [Pseudomonadota bacterium]